MIHECMHEMMVGCIWEGVEMLAYQGVLVDIWFINGFDKLLNY